MRLRRPMTIGSLARAAIGVGEAYPPKAARRRGPGNSPANARNDRRSLRRMALRTGVLGIRMAAVCRRGAVPGTDPVIHDVPYDLGLFIHERRSAGTKGGNSLTIAFTPPFPHSGLFVETNPAASAPASTATAVSSAFVNPGRFFTFTVMRQQRVLLFASRKIRDRTTGSLPLGLKVRLIKSCRIHPAEGSSTRTLRPPVFKRMTARGDAHL